MVLAVAAGLALAATVTGAVLVTHRQGAGGWVAWVVLAVVAAATAWGWWAIGRNTASRAWAERDADLLVRHGFLVRTLTVVPYGRMQVVDVRAGPLARSLGYAAVTLVTASPQTDAAVLGVPAAEAVALRDRLAGRGEGHAGGL